MSALARQVPLYERKPLSWRPRHRGDAYCSPACGGGCTQEAFQEATRLAAALAQRLGQGWEPNVWENLGWHYSALVPGEARFEVHGSKRYGQKRTTYMCFLGSTYVSKSRRTPEEAVRESLAMAAKDLAALQTLTRLAALKTGPLALAAGKKGGAQ